MPEAQHHEHDKPRPSTSSDRGRVALEVSSTVLKALETVAKVSPVPGMAQAAGLALQISDTVQKVKVNQAAFSRLADDATQLVYVIFCTHKNITKEEDVDPNLKANLDDVLKVLLDVQELANKGASRGKFAGFWRSTVDEDNIAEYRQRLQHCLNKFGFESDLTIRVMVTKLTAQNERMMEMLEHGRSQNDSGIDGRGSTDERDGQRHNAPNQPSSGQNGDSDARMSRATPELDSTVITFGEGANFSGASAIAIGSHNKLNSGSQ